MSAIINPAPAGPPPAAVPPRPPRRSGAPLLAGAICPDAAMHTPAPVGYLAWHAWAARLSRTHHQVRCPSCGLWAVWVPGRPAREPLPADEQLQRLLEAASAVVAIGQGNLRQPAYGQRAQAYDDLRDALEEYGQW